MAGVIERLGSAIKWARIGFKAAGDNRLLSALSTFGANNSVERWQPGNYEKQIDQVISWSFACIDRIAKRVSQVGLKLYRKDPDGEHTEIRQHTFLDSIHTVNNWYNQSELMYLTSAYLDAIGNAYWYIVYKNVAGKKVPAEFWPMLSHRVRIVPDKNTFISGYTYQSLNGTKLEFSTDEILHFKLPSLTDPYYGYGTLEAAQYPVTLDEQFSKYDISLMKNNATPGGFLMLDGNPNEESRTNFKDKFDKEYKGVKNAGKTMLLWGDVKDYKRVAFTPAELDSGAMDSKIRDKICSIFGVPVSKLGLDVTQARANTEANDHIFNEETIKPRLNFIQEKINEKLMPIYDPKIMVIFDNPIPKYFDDIIKQDDADVRNGIRTINEIREERGLDAVPWGEVPLMPFNLQPIGTPQPEVQPGAEEQQQSIKSITKKALRSIVWKDLKVRTIPMITNMKMMLDRFFDSQKKEVLENLKNIKVSERDIAKILFDKLKADKKLKGSSSLYIKNSSESAARSTAALFGLDIDWNTVIPNIDKWAGIRAETFSKWVNETTLGDLKGILSQGITDGESISQLSDRISSFFDGSIANRSEMIARTEIITANNEGSLETYREAGVEKKEWFTTPDDALCVSCESMDEQVVDVADDFVDETGTFDPVNVPTLHPNCRCTVLPVIER